MLARADLCGNRQNPFRLVDTGPQKWGQQIHSISFLLQEIWDSAKCGNESNEKKTKIRNNTNHFRKGFRFPQSGVNGMDFLWSHVPSLLESSCWFVRWMAVIVCHCGTLIGQSSPNLAVLFWHGKWDSVPDVDFVVLKRKNLHPWTLTTTC